MRDAELKERTKKFAIEVIKLTEQLPRNRVTDVVGKQLMRAGTSVGANYRAACRAKSRADFVAMTVSSIRTARNNTVRSSK